MRRRAVILSLVTLAASVVGGCGPSRTALAGLGAGGGPRSVGVGFDAAAYPRVFEAAKDELRARGFELDRVDARAGVITTSGMLSAGALTPWVGGAGPSASIDDTFHRNERVVRVVFARATPEGTLSVDRATWPGSGGAADLRLWPGAVTVRVEVDVFRSYEPGRRVDANSIRLAHDARVLSSVGPATGPGGDIGGTGRSVTASVERVASDRELADSILAGVRARGL